MVDAGLICFMLCVKMCGLRIAIVGLLAAAASAASLRGLVRLLPSVPSVLNCITNDDSRFYWHTFFNVLFSAKKWHADEHLRQIWRLFPH
jgi:hypothetical protein